MDYDDLSSRFSPGSLKQDSSFGVANLRFVILWHSLPSDFAGQTSQSRSDSSQWVGGQRVSHFDLMFEFGDALKTYELLRLPIPGERIPVQNLADHRLHYLDYEGPVSNNRGHVTRWAKGTYRTIRSGFNEHDEKKWIVDLFSDRLHARLAILEILGKHYVRASRWELMGTKRP
jgi:hypothetical protein